MSTSRRAFLGKLTGAAAAFSLAPLGNQLWAEELADAQLRIAPLGPEEAAMEEDFWAIIQQAYTVSPNLLNLNNGGVSPQPKIVQDAVDRFNRMSNEAPTYMMWEQLNAGREVVRKGLADLAGVTPEEIVINRNATEGLDTVILGISLKKGDEVVLTKQDYPNMINTWKLRETRDGIKLVWVDLPLPLENDEDIVRRFEEKVTAQTRVIMITHMINWAGQLLPTRKICDMARKKGIVTIVDAAHSFAQVVFNVREWGCDYMGTALHKWLCAPFGTGMLYVKKERIKETYPVFANDKFASDDILKFENLGTRNVPAEMAIGHALDFHLAIGAARKEARLRWLKDYWARPLAQEDRMHVHTSFHKDYACALALVSIDGIKPATLAAWLRKEQQIVTVPIDWENLHGIRITPHVYTRPRELDRFIEAMRKARKEIKPDAE
ncbi:MAG: aminotransferase class V-fold PLP-dependent enzyme [Bacteroidetes bacterium]|nr:aminotransferase class V-fold PLP-dependent enzyme [Bacteroidota bacterium]